MTLSSRETAAKIDNLLDRFADSDFVRREPCSARSSIPVLHCLGFRVHQTLNHYDVHGRRLPILVEIAAEKQQNLTVPRHLLTRHVLFLQLVPHC